MNIDLRSPSFSTLSKRLKTLGLKQPVYRLAHRNGCDIKMIAIDSSGLKCYGQDEWVREKYGETSEKRNWRKLHVIVDQYNIIQTSELTIRKIHDASVVDTLIAPMSNKVKQVTADTAYDTNNVYHLLDKEFSHVDIVIPPRSNAIDEKRNHWMRNRNLREIKCYGRMKWQTDRDYGKRNQAERAIGCFNPNVFKRFDNVLKLGERKSTFIILNNALTKPSRCLSGVKYLSYLMYSHNAMLLNNSGALLPS